ncbi:hypothetical protein TNCV_2773311 [Trichonephila clavipes]|nr:hypothetical protein TNCV_1384581 [Trichonephila clavipes]GFV30082.1 hypothetical protein TNCV_2773311 [Trichonephila clavipes]
MATGSYLTPNYSRSQITIRLNNGSISFRLAKASQMEIRSIMFSGVNWYCTQTSSFFLNQTLLNGLKLFYGRSLAPGRCYDY